jgi:tetratricopeptide (TPR) repeat protein
MAHCGPSAALVDGLVGRSAALRNLGRLPEAANDARRALALAREIGYRAGKALAVASLGSAAHYAGDFEESLSWARQAAQIDPADLPDWVGRHCVRVMAAALMEAGQAASAQESCAEGLARAREAGDLADQADFLWLTAELDLRTGRMSDAGAHLRESLEVTAQTGERLRMTDCLDTCGHLCAATHRWVAAFYAGAVVLWGIAVLVALYVWR